MRMLVEVPIRVEQSRSQSFEGLNKKRCNHPSQHVNKYTYKDKLMEAGG